MRAIWLIMLGVGISGVAQAASFDCNKAGTPIEKAICSDAGLSKLDAELGRAYTKALSGDKDKAQFVRDSQKSWISIEQQQCSNDVSCLTTTYQARVAALQGLGAPESAGSDFVFDKIAKHYRFAVHLYQHCDAKQASEGGGCDAPARLTITAKDNSRAPQVIYLARLLMPFLSDGKPLANSNVLYDDQGVINVGDFNFDGQEDFAVQVGNDGSYGGPNFDVYLNVGGKFVYNGDLSELTQESLGFFNVFPNLHQLTTFEKSGCCWHQTTSYHVIDNKPVAFERTIEDARDMDDPSDQPYEYTEQLIDGHWKLIGATGKRPDDFCEEVLLNAVNAKGNPPAEQPACKPLPNEPKTGVAAALSNTDRRRSLDLYYVNMDNGNVVAHKHIDDAYVFPDDKDAISALHHLKVDTARYQLNANMRAIGVRATFWTRGNVGTYTMMSLFYRNGGDIVPVMDHLVVDSDQDSFKRTLDIGRASSNGFADIVVHELAAVGEDGKAIHGKRDYVLHFDGKHYVVPEELTRHTQ